MTDKNLYAYCDNNPVTREDKYGKFWLTVGTMAIGAAVNIITTVIAASVVGEKCDAMDLVIAGVSGALMTVPGLASWVGIGNALYAGYKSRINGANWGEALIVAGTAGLCSASSFSAAAKLSQSWTNTIIGASVDLVFSTGLNSVSAAVYKGVTPNSSKSKAKPAESKFKTSHYEPLVDNVSFPGRKDYGEYGLLYNWLPQYAR